MKPFAMVYGLSIGVAAQEMFSHGSYLWLGIFSVLAIAGFCLHLRELDIAKEQP